MIANVLGIDPSSRVIGWALLQDGRYVESGTWTSDFEEFGDRHWSLHNQAKDWFRDTVQAKTPIDLVAVEHARAYRNARTQTALDKMAGLIEIQAKTSQMLSLPVYPAEWHAEAKAYLDNNGMAMGPKQISRQAALLLTGNEKMTEDECDALWIAKYASRVGVSNRVAE